MPGTDEAAKAITAAAVDSFRDTPDPRLRGLLQGLVRHLHGYVRELRPTIQEWEYAVDYLTAVGHTCDPTRQEFILLSDVLGANPREVTADGPGRLLRAAWTGQPPTA
ncbi:hypothetical protein IOD14_19900 [Streptomyces sp. A2-16]|uniref:dioxygenase n=1 Tax=Streptomyces sp. A2-16 TaxID=2781734 RepID=UPI001BB02FAC|nr:hypothetical protein IOD14_19900 [Streptomyces sp. A2-16]